MILTHQQERFAQEVASGKSQAEAYRIAYPKSLNWKPETVWNNASVLMRNSGVLARVETIRAELAERGLWSREQSVKALIGVIESPDKQADIIAAVKALNEMHDFNSPMKLNVSGGLNVVVSYED